MSFFLRVKSITYTPIQDYDFDDVRGKFNSGLNNYDLTTTFNTTKYEEETIEFDENDIGAWLCVNTMTSSFEMDNYDKTQPCCNSADMIPYMLSDGTWLGDVLPYLLDPNKDRICRYGTLKITFSNDNYIIFSTDIYSSNIRIDKTDNYIPSIVIGSLLFYNKDGDLLITQGIDSSTRYLKVIIEDLYSNSSQTKISSGLFPFNLTPDFNSINDAQSLSDTYRDLEVDYDFNNKKGNYKAPLLPLIRIMYLNDKIDNGIFDYSKGVLTSAINKSDNDENMPNYLDSLTVQFDGYFNLIRNNQDATWVNANESLSEEAGIGNDRAKDGWYYVKTNKNNIVDNDFSLLKNFNHQSQISEFFDGMESSTTPITPGGGGFGPDSGPGGGGGNFDNSSEDIDFPSLPSLSAVSTGFTSIYNPSNSQLNALADKMWDSGLLEQIKQLWSNPMDAIMSLSITFAPMPPVVNSSVKLGTYDTEITMPKLQSQYSILDCGTINVNEYWGNFLDYTQTSCYIYLPFIGIEELAIKDVMDATVHVQYHIDVLSGAVVAFVKCTKEELNSVIYTYSGNCNTPVPISRLDASALWTGAYNTVMKGVGTIANSIASATKTATNPTPSNMANASSESIQGTLGLVQATGDFIMNPKTSVQRSGSIGGSSGLLGIKYPFLILTRPKQQKPSNYQSYYGLTSHITKKLGECIGFTKVANIHLDGVTATDQEKDMIMSALTAGVFL